jgi:D-glycero-alpha-D-manno-heptose-7-phosphate kinase
MIITRTPFRISFFGGGTDYPAWYREHGGAVISTTIDKYCYIMVRPLPPFFEHRFAIRYSRIETCNTVEEIEHPSVKATYQFLKIARGLELNHDGDLPARSGLGSSSTFTVGLLNALHALHGRMPTKKQLAKDALHVEQELIGETVGSQDQVAAAYGGFNHISFMENGDFSVRPVTILPERIAELNQRLMLFYTGIRRLASEVAASFVPHLDEKHRQLRLMQTLVDEGISVLSSREEIDRFGKLLHEAWLAKRSLSSSITSPVIDQIYDGARDAGAVGGKLIGAGGGGFLLLFVPPDRQIAVRERLAELVHVPIRFESSGSQVIFSDAEPDYATEEMSRPMRLATIAQAKARAALETAPAEVHQAFIQ